MNREFELSLMLSNDFKQKILAEREKYWIDQYGKGAKDLNLAEFAKAEVALRTAILIDATRPEAYKKLAIAYLNLSKPEKSLQIYTKLLSKHPSDLDLLSSTANLYYSQEDYTSVIPILKRILELEPHHRDALANLALSYDSLGETEQAYNAYLDAIKANPDDKDLVFLYGVHHYRQEKYEEAIKIFQQVLERDPSDLETVSNIGNAYLSIAEGVRKKLKSSRGNKVSVEDVQRLKQSAIVNYQNAIPYLEKSLAERPEQPMLWQNLGIAYINTGKREKGEKAFLKAEELRTQTAK